MVGDVNGEQTNWNRKLALEEIENLKSLRSAAWVQHSDAFKWLMASLLAVNGGACLAVMDASELTIGFRLASMGLFVFGIMTALLIAVFGQHSVQSSFVPLQKLIGYWMTVVDDGERMEEMEEEIGDELKRSARIGVGTRIAGWVSALAFLAGIVTAGLGLMSDQTAVVTTGRPPPSTASSKAPTLPSTAKESMSDP